MNKGGYDVTIIDSIISGGGIGISAPKGTKIYSEGTQYINLKKGIELRDDPKEFLFSSLGLDTDSDIDLPKLIQELKKVNSTSEEDVASYIKSSGWKKFLDKTKNIPEFIKNVTFIVSCCTESVANIDQVITAIKQSNLI